MSYEFDSILLRLKEGLKGGISAMEGTFAGDILQAVAAELARIWSQEIDTVTLRSFAATAQGEWLDALAGNYGLSRRPGEGDEDFRQRVLYWLRRRGAGGSAADYVVWAMEVDGVAAAAVVPLGRGAGTVDVYFVPQPGKEGVKQALEAHLEQLRPVGASVQVIQAQPQAVAVSAKVTLEAGASLSQVYEAYVQALDEFFRGKELSAEGQTVSVNQAVGLLMKCSGVTDGAEVKLNGSAGKLVIPRGSYGVLGSVTLEEAAHE